MQRVCSLVGGDYSIPSRDDEIDSRASTVSPPACSTTAATTTPPPTSVVALGLSESPVVERPHLTGFVSSEC